MRRSVPFIPLLAIALIFAKDRFLPDPPFLLDALTDEPAHVATALLFVCALYALLRRPVTRPVIVGTVLGGTLIDLDHLPAALGWDGLVVEGSRPFTHSLTTLALLLLVARGLRGTRRGVALAAALGLASHLLRDMSYGLVPLFWPITPRSVMLPYVAYALTVLLCGGLLVVRRRCCGRWRCH